MQISKTQAACSLNLKRCSYSIIAWQCFVEISSKWMNLSLPICHWNNLRIRPFFISWEAYKLLHPDQTSKMSTLNKALNLQHLASSPWSDNTSPLEASPTSQFPQIACNRSTGHPAIFQDHSLDKILKIYVFCLSCEIVKVLQQRKLLSSSS